ncbi:hypothetical protein HYH03_012792 [Edaphochlamys debaryana]|uniref:phytol kinase n=1 Tax=Edaphochlamys debaryana TaxID=47281 RepID=A0A836BV44_9CHLO|nr:hypothetical protein HYH03_012792 [Edaphochlamys debaryana]|eukprot:KAG2488619.1 hypothetical protein HYH03_012792 [Edaphochlamys debaryana]
MKLWSQACEEAGTVPWLTARMSAILPLVESLASAPQSSQDRNRTTARLFTIQSAGLVAAGAPGLTGSGGQGRPGGDAGAGHPPGGPDLAAAHLAGGGGRGPGRRRLRAGARGACAGGLALPRHGPGPRRVRQPGVQPRARLRSRHPGGCLLAAPSGGLRTAGPVAGGEPAAYWLPAVARCVLHCPGPDPHDLYDPHGGERGDEGTALTHIADVHAATVELSVALESVLRWLCGAGAADAAPQLASQLSHPDVVALQEALLERLCVHGGVEGEEEGRDGGPAEAGQEQREGEGRDDGRAGGGGPVGAGGGGGCGGVQRALGPLLEATRSAESAAWALALHTEPLQGELEGRRCSEALPQQLQRLAAATVATSVSVLLILDCLGPPLLVARYGLSGGVAVTLGKRARMVTRRLQELEAEAEPKGRGKDERQRAARAREAERLLLSTVIRCLLQPMPSCLLLADAALFRVYGENCTVYGTGALPYKADQALFVERAACALATHVTARAALRRPHRLLAAACKLLCPGVAAPMGRGPFCDEGDDVSSDLPRRLRFDIAAAVFALAADSGLSSRAQAWLLPPEGAVCGAAEGAAAAAGEAERGCLEPLLRYRLLPQLRAAEAPGVASALLLLLAAACTSGNGSDGGGTDSTDGAAAQSTGGEFCALASTLFTSVPGRMSPGQWGRTDAATKQEKLLLDQCGGLASGQGFVLLAHYVALKASVEAGGSGMWPRQAELLAAPLPPPIAVPLAEAALPGLRVCAYPGCLSYGGRSEAKLRLQKCGRCKCVRYCGPDCGAAHWREGHEGECHSH